MSENETDKPAPTQEEIKNAIDHNCEEATKIFVECLLKIEDYFGVILPTINCEIENDTTVWEISMKRVQK